MLNSRQRDWFFLSITKYLSVEIHYGNGIPTLILVSYICSLDNYIKMPVEKHK